MLEMEEIPRVIQTSFHFISEETEPFITRDRNRRFQGSFLMEKCSFSCTVLFSGIFSGLYGGQLMAKQLNTFVCNKYQTLNYQMFNL
jgi:hypothetical protein